MCQGWGQTVACSGTQELEEALAGSVAVSADSVCYRSSCSREWRCGGFGCEMWACVHTLTSARSLLVVAN